MSIRTQAAYLLILGGGFFWGAPPLVVANEHPCAGRCHYCVDGICIPRRATYGYYEPNWRRWFRPSMVPSGPARSTCPASNERSTSSTMLCRL